MAPNVKQYFPRVVSTFTFTRVLVFSVSPRPPVKILAVHRLALTDAYGVYHCTNSGTCSWFDLASEAVDLAGVPCEKEALTSVEYKQRFPQSADRPAYSSLDNARLCETIGDEMRPWREALADYIRNLPELGG